MEVCYRVKAQICAIESALSFVSMVQLYNSGKQVLQCGAVSHCVEVEQAEKWGGACEGNYPLLTQPTTIQWYTSYYYSLLTQSSLWVFLYYLKSIQVLYYYYPLLFSPIQPNDAHQSTQILINYVFIGKFRPPPQKESQNFGKFISKFLSPIPLITRPPHSWNFVMV